jgi:hypothetical protein
MKFGEDVTLLVTKEVLQSLTTRKIVRCNGDKAIAHATPRIQSNFAETYVFVFDTRKCVFYNLIMAGRKLMKIRRAI